MAGAARSIDAKPSARAWRRRKGAGCLRAMKRERTCPTTASSSTMPNADTRKPARCAPWISKVRLD